MVESQVFQKIYNDAERGKFDTTFFSIDSGKNEIGIDVKKLKKACRDEGVDFDTFLKYGQKRKREEKRQPND